jgi:lipoprotein-anchoring transpeptidase ErfK/SrfK
MQNTHLRARLTQMLLAGVLIGLMTLTSACGGNAQTQKQASQSKAQLDHLLQYAKNIGVPLAMFQPILTQEQQLSKSSAPFTLFNNQPAANYYQNLATRYKQLTVQVQGIIMSATQQFQSRAQYDMQNFQLALTQERISGHFPNIDLFSQRFSRDQLLLAAAQYPKDYAVISYNARLSTAALNLVEPTFNSLNTLKSTISQMQAASLDVTALQVEYKGDTDAYNSATTSQDFQNLNALVDAQYQQTLVSSFQALPYIGAAKLSEFQTEVNLLKTYGLDASSYQRHLASYQAAFQKALSLNDYLAVAARIQADITSMHDMLVQGQAIYLVNYINQQATEWGNAHAYHDKFDGKNYILTAGYALPGIGFWLNRELGWTYTTADYQSVIDEENNELFDLQMLEQDYYDPTPYNHVHTTDLEMLNHYNLNHSQVLMISEVEQALRLYQNGNLVASFHVTTGRVERPALPGVWTVQNRQSPTEFKSNDPPGSPFWYPPTLIHYAILYHWGGFYVHDAWWRQDYGPGTQFPHYDSGGDETFSGNGSHGCINMQEDQAAWVYTHTDWNTIIAVY